MFNVYVTVDIPLTETPFGMSDWFQTVLSRILSNKISIISIITSGELCNFWNINYGETKTENNQLFTKKIFMIDQSSVKRVFCESEMPCIRLKKM